MSQQRQIDYLARRGYRYLRTHGAGIVMCRADGVAVTVGPAGQILGYPRHTHGAGR